MTIYPGAIDEFRTTQNIPGILYDAADTKTVFAEDTNNHSDAIVAIENELGTNPAGAFANVASRLDGIDTTLSGKENSLGYTAENAANKSTSSSLGTSNTLYPSQNAVKAYVDAAVSAAKQALYPVGSIWTSTSVSTNPGTVLGFGTWSAFGAGRVLVSKAVSGTFGTIGATGGSETVTLISAEMPSHTHTRGTMEITGNVLTSWTDNSGGGLIFGFGGSGAFSTSHVGTARWAAATATGGTQPNQLNFTASAGWTGSTSSSGGNGAHNNLQPYIVVYMWERTA